MKISDHHFANRSRFALFVLFAFLLTYFIHPQLYQLSVRSSAHSQLSPVAFVPTELFFSEYIEGSSNNKALEIYNGTGAPINLGTNGYNVQMFFNGSATAGLTINLTGTVANGDVFVLAQSSADAAILAQADQTNSSGWYNGDDAVVLRKGTTIIDVIGQVENDPGTEWGTGLTSTADNTLRRKIGIETGDANGGDAFNPATEWNGFATDTFSGLGSHTIAVPVLPNLTISDVSQAEGNSGTTTFNFSVNLSAPAGPGGVTFDIATADGTAQDDNPTSEDNDYVPQSLTGQTIPAGSSSYSFNVTVNGDTTAEANQTFFVNVTNVTGANVADGQGQGTIQNDDVALTPIHDIQGPGNSSPIVGASVSTRGVVTGVKNNGFFIQEPDATVDADPASSEGIFVFTNSTLPAAAAVGNLVQVTATVVEFVPSQDPLQPPLTELSSPTVVLISSGNPLPAAIPLTPTFPNPAGPFDQLERVEGMRVSAVSFTVWGPTGGNVNEPDATATSTGVFFGSITGVARPFREPGIQAPDPAPSGSIPPIPRWDSNPELLRVDSDGIGAPILDVNTSAVVTGMVGPLDYGFRRYTILPQPQTPPSVAGGVMPTAAATPDGNEITVASYNLERFYDTLNDTDIGEPILTAAAYDERLNKASEGIRNYLHTPDILGVIEVENLSTLQDLAARINSDAVANSQPDPQYDAYLVEGNDVGGIDVGFLVKTSPVAGSTPRVEVVEVQQELDGTLFVNPDSSTETLNDRPPLRLKAVVHFPGGGTFPVTVIVNHMRSLNDSDSISPGANGWATVGARVRAKRQKQAEDLANLVQARQTADPTERIMLIGDFNAFEFNDGFGDSMGVIEGTPVPDNQTAVPGDGVDLVNPDLDNLFDTELPTERYSFVFEGNAQSLDHIVVNQALLDSASSVRLDHARINADFPQTARNSTGVERLADHDPAIAYISLEAPIAMDDSFSTNEDTMLNVAAPGVLDNDSDNENDTLTATIVSGPSNALSFTLNPDGSFSYTPATNFNGQDSFTYKATDGSSESNVATVTINVNAVNDAPTISGMTVTRQQTAAGTISVIATVSDVDNASSSLSVMTTTVPAGITVTGITNNNDGTISATVQAGCAAALGNNPVGLKVSDSGGEMGTGTLTVNVTAENTLPVIDPVANVAVSVPPNVPSTSVTFPLPTATDNCGAAVTVETDPVSGSMFNLGTTTVNVKATDQAGNMSFSSFTVTVTQQYQFSWFYYSDLLLKENVLNQVTAGSNVPIRFTLNGYKGNPYSSPPVSQQISCSTLAPIGAASVINRFMPDPYYSPYFDFYQTTWQTQGAWKFTCRRLTLSLTDGTTKSLNFYFK